MVLRCLTLATIVTFLTQSPTMADDHPLSQKQRDQFAATFDADIEKLSKQIEKSPKEVGLYSQRGDAYFFRARFKDAVADYEKMVELDAKRDASHWRRGIAYFYVAKYKQAAHQFEIYHSFDDVDRENGIWRYLSQHKAYGQKKARQGLLKYKKDDREPFPAVYKLFAGMITPDAILKQIADAKISDEAREVRLCYAQLYIGLNYAVEKNSKQAIIHLREATANKWGPRASYGPKYMWHVGRLHYELLLVEQKKKAKK